MRRFYMDRQGDPAGISGTGRVLQGVVFQSGKTVIEWLKPISNITIFFSFDEFVGIHLADGRAENVISWVYQSDEA